jgi:L-threonylcarbamoyladenylate synthase
MAPRLVFFACFLHSLLHETTCFSREKCKNLTKFHESAYYGIFHINLYAASTYSIFHLKKAQQKFSTFPFASRKSQRICSRTPDMDNRIHHKMETEIVTINAAELDGEKIRKAAHLLDLGQIVAFPTETVYGLGCLAEPPAIARLDHVKGRPPDKRYTLHIADPDTVFRYVPAPNPRARKLLRKVWPGPVTIVFDLTKADLDKQKRMLSPGAFDVLYRDGTIGIRCIDNDLGQALLRRAMGPVVAPSANRSGQKPATTPAEVFDEFKGEIPLILAAGGGPTMCGQSSTVVRITGASVEVIRQGAVSKEVIDEISRVRFLFVCTGNTCRSPMAEGISRKLLSQRLNCSIDELNSAGYIVLSCGVAASGASGASPQAVEVCRGLNIDIADHRSRPFDCEEARQYDYVFGMTRQHVEAITEHCPEMAKKCVLLDENGDIADPVGGGIETYRQCAAQIEKALEKRLGEIWDENRGSK